MTGVRITTQTTERLTGRQIRYLVTLAEPVSGQIEQRMLEAIAMIRGVIAVDCVDPRIDREREPTPADLAAVESLAQLFRASRDLPLPEALRFLGNVLRACTEELGRLEYAQRGRS